MECLICGKNLSNLGVHVVKKHKVSVKDYKLKFNIPFTFALIEEDLKIRISKKAKIRSETPEGMAHLKKIHDMSIIAMAENTPIHPPIPECSSLKRKQVCYNNRKEIVLRNIDKSKKKILENKELVSDYLKGVSFNDLYVKYDICKATLFKYLKSIGDRNIDTYRKYKHINRESICAEYESGKTCKELAVKYNVKLASVQKWIYLMRKREQGEKVNESNS